MIHAVSYCELKSLLILTHSLDPSWSDRSVTVQKARDPIASETESLFGTLQISVDVKMSWAVQVQTPEHSGGADIIGRAGADLIGSAGAVNPAVQSFQPGQRYSPDPSGNTLKRDQREQPPDLED